MRYDDAVESLFQAPHDQFVTERKRLAGELKAAGDKDGAARLAKLARPPISAWVVDQLWWRARAAFEALFESADLVRRGDLGASGAHREALAALRVHAIQILTDAQHGTTESTLRRVAQTLSALAAAGTWDPDPPGALSADRDPPGFEALGIGNVIPFPVQPREPAPHGSAARDTSAHESSARDFSARDSSEVTDLPRIRREAGEPHQRRERAARDASGHESPARDGETDLARARREADEARLHRERAAATARAEAAADLRRAEAERARAAAERNRLEAALRTARGDVAQREREVVKLERDLAYARTLVAQAREVVLGLEERLAQLDN
jgi:hypothetical protein